MNVATVILAAGFGTRMNSKLPKVMHSLAGRPMVDWAVRTGEQLTARRPVVVVGHGQAQVRALLKDRVEYAEQLQLLGTGHALMQARPLLQGNCDTVLVFYGDMPLLQVDTLAHLLTHFRTQRAATDLALAMLTIERADSQGFGRIVRDIQGRMVAIVEEVACTPEQRLIRELNPGIYCFDADWLWRNLSSLPLSAKGEYYLTDMVGIAVAQGRSVATKLAPLEDVYGINTRVQLAEAAAVLRRRVAERHMLNGVTIIDPATTYIDDTVTIGRDTTVYPGCLLQGATVIGEECVIGPNSQVVDSVVGDDCRVTYSVIEQARLDDHAEIGPFGRLRPGAHLGEGVHMGSFGEVKNSYLGAGVKMGHFSYVGDADVGENAMLAAGVITCNFDGVQKNRTIIGKDAFIGSDTLLVAPVTIGEGAKTGAGSVVTHDVADHAVVYGVPARARPPASSPTDNYSADKSE